jgi:two-component system OmpR family response regulator
MWSSAESAAPRILVVDDEEVILTLTNRALRNAGYEAVAASDGTEASDVVQHQHRPFDVFVLDVRMPHMTGDELAEQLRRIDPDCKVLYFTGFADQLFDHKSTLWANEGFIEKPASTAELLEAVSLLLYGHTHGPTPAAT